MKRRKVCDIVNDETVNIDIVHENLISKTHNVGGVDTYVYGNIRDYTARVKPSVRPIEGRDVEIAAIRASFMRPELCNIILLAEAGSGKTALVQAVQDFDKERLYLEVDLSKMIAASVNDTSEVAAMLKALFDEVSNIHSDMGVEVVLFIDEFHQIVQINAAAVEVLKPLLADSGTRGIRVVAATTYEEFVQFVQPNQALVERLQRISLTQPGEEVTCSILKGMCEKYGMMGRVTDPKALFPAIYEYTNRYLPSQSQPRKSIRMIDAMIGVSKFNNRPLDIGLLADVLYESEGINVAFKANASQMEENLKKRVFNQDLAIRSVCDVLHIASARLNDETRPLASFLFTGSTGTGKTELSKAMSGELFNDSRNMIRFDMSEFALETSMQVFREELTSKVWARPNSVILLDEIEKSCGAVTRLLLQVLDDGKLNDASNREVSFKNSCVVITTNAASEVYGDIVNYDGIQSSDPEVRNRAMSEALETNIRNIRESLKNSSKDNSFPPELLGRIDAIVPFAPLTEETQKSIAKRKLAGLWKTVQSKHGVVLDAISVEQRDRIVNFVVEEMGDTAADAGGARATVSNVNKYVTGPVAKFINDNPYKKRAYVYVDGTLRNEGNTTIKSKATIKVSERMPRLKQNNKKEI